MSQAPARKSRILVATTSRADFGIYRPVLQELEQTISCDVGLLVGGMHMLPEYGSTIFEVEASGHRVDDQFESLVASDSPEGISKAIGLTTIGAAQSLARLKPDVLFVLGDRYEMLAIALAAVPFGIPIAHLHGGEETEGAIDNVLRHAITKFSHLHFCSTQLAATRIRNMGEAPERVIVSGAPALDLAKKLAPMTKEQLSAKFGFNLEDRFALMTYHPVTLEEDGGLAGLEATLSVLDTLDMQCVFTASNADAFGRAVNERLRQAVAGSDRFKLVENMGSQAHFSSMRYADFLIGNSSSGILEAASVGLPVVNIGIRQKGRETSPNTISVTDQANAIRMGIEQALSADHMAICKQNLNVYGTGEAAQIIATSLQAALARGLSAQKAFFTVGKF